MKNDLEKYSTDTARPRCYTLFPGQRLKRFQLTGANLRPKNRRYAGRIFEKTLTVQFDVTVSSTERILRHAFVRAKVPRPDVSNLQHHVLVVAVVGGHRLIFIACNRMVIA